MNLLHGGGVLGGGGSTAERIVILDIEYILDKNYIILL
jgi:hypothetical protein